MLLSLPSEIIALVIRSMTYLDLKACRLTCRFLRNGSTMWVEEIEQNDTTSLRRNLRPRNVLSLYRVQSISFWYWICPNNLSDLDLLFGHRSLDRFNLDYVLIDDDIFDYLTQHPLRCNHDVMISYNEHPVVLVDHQAVKVYNFVEGSFLNFIQTCGRDGKRYEGPFDPNLSLYTSFRSLSFTHPDILDGLTPFLTRTNSLNFIYSRMTMGRVRFAVDTWFETLDWSSTVLPSIQELGCVNAKYIPILNRIFPSLQRVELSLFTLMNEDGRYLNMLSLAASAYQVIIQAEFYYTLIPPIVEDLVKKIGSKRVLISSCLF